MSESARGFLDRSAMDFRRMLTPWHHVGVGSGWGVVRPLMGTVCGVGAVFAPPFAASDLVLRLVLEVDGHALVDDGNIGKGDCGLLWSGGAWRLDRVERVGTYHHRINGKLISLAVHSELTALCGQAGFVLAVEVVNRGPEAVRVTVSPKVQPGRPARVELSKWDFGPPQDRGQEMDSVAPGRWMNDQVSLTITQDRSSLTIPAGQPAKMTLAAVLGGIALADRCVDEAEASTVDGAASRLDSWRRQTLAAWERRCAGVLERLPLLETDVPGLQAYYDRSLVSGLVCLWDRPDFVIDPFVATLGMDGGGICCYPWDTGGYAPHAVSLMLGPKTQDLIRILSVKDLLANHSRIAPDGTPSNFPYTYNLFSMVNLAYAAACLYGSNRSLFETVRDAVLAIEAGLHLRGDLADCGRQHNLLEMRQTGWEHFVVSPNAERAWCLEKLAEMGEAFGVPETADWRAKAHRIRQQVREELWDPQAGWFRCVFPDGHEERVYSIQVFDALRAGACTPEMAERVLSHVREGAFLGRYGVSSVSAEDAAHYELNDPDWSGGGAYTGDGPLLALALWEHSRPDLAWDVLRRFFWMGEHLLYYPQEHYCDRPAVPAHKRANSIAGLAGVEAVMLGLCGLRFGPNGSVRWRPWPVPEGHVELKGLHVRGRLIDISLTPDEVATRVDGKTLYAGPPGGIVELIP